MHLARPILRVLTLIVAVSASTFVLSGNARANRVPLLGSGATVPGGTSSSFTSARGMIVAVDPDSVPCTQTATFDDLDGGDGTNYDGLVWSGGLMFAERFAGQTLSYSDVFDVVSGTPINPLTPQVGLPAQNLVVFDYTTNVLSGLGPLGFSDFDAIGEGAMAVYFPLPQSRVSFQLVGGNGGSATVGFYRADGSLIDNVVVSGLAELYYGFGTANGSTSIAGILIQNTDPSGIGLDNVCYSGGSVGTHTVSWGGLKVLYR
jgi:hypothetical protein